MAALYTYFYIFRTYTNLAYKVYWRNNIATRQLFQELKKALGFKVISSKTRVRILSYTRQSYLTASWSCALRGQSLTNKERKAVLYIGAITPLLDDLTDAFQLRSHEILHLLKDEHATASKEEVNIARYLYHALVSLDITHFNKRFKEALVAQDASIQQLADKKISDDALKKIARDKGGAFVILYRTVLETPLKDSEMEALTTLGSVLQQLNDMFDVYKDHINGQQTLYTNTNDIYINYQDYRASLNKLVSQYYATDYASAHIRKCLAEVSTVTSRGLVCLEQLRALQGTDGIFAIKNYSRQQLICDMERVSNFKKSFSYSVQFFDTLP